MKKSKQGKSNAKNAAAAALQNFRNRFNTQSSGTNANAYVAKAVTENKTAQRPVRRVQNPK